MSDFMKSSIPSTSKGRGRSLPSSGQGASHPPAMKRRAVAPSEHQSTNLGDIEMDSIDSMDHPNAHADSGGSVYRSNQYAYFISCAPLMHLRVPLTVIDVNLALFDPVLTAMYDAFKHTCYASASQFIPITLANFIRVCRLCIKARIDFVYMRQTGARAHDRVNINQAPDMPRCLAEMVNGIGFLTAWNGFSEICPHAIQEVEELNDRAARTPANIVGQFTLFVKNIAKKGFTTLTPLSRTEDGTRYWVMQARDLVVAQPRTAEGNAEIVNCRTQIDSSTPGDIMLAAIVQNGFDGNIAPMNFFVYESDPITGIQAIRTKFFLSK